MTAARVREHPWAGRAALVLAAALAVALAAALSAPAAVGGSAPF